VHEVPEQSTLLAASCPAELAALEASLAALEASLAAELAALLAELAALLAAGPAAELAAELAALSAEEPVFSSLPLQLASGSRRRPPRARLNTSRRLRVFDVVMDRA